MENPISEQSLPTRNAIIKEASVLGHMVLKWVNALPWTQKLTKNQLNIAIYIIYGMLAFIHLKYILTYGIHPPFLWGWYFWKSLVITIGSIWVLTYWYGKNKQIV